MIRCQPPRLLQTNISADYLGIKSDYLCPEHNDFYVQGMFSSEDAQFIQIAIRDCSQETLDTKYNKTIKCMSKEKSLYAVNRIKLSLVVENSYFKDSDFSENPIKKFL
jgi:hypothetical protein